MAEGNNIHDEIKEQRAKFKELSFKEKVQYIWQYYRLLIFAIILGALFVGSLAYSIIKNNYDTVCYIAVIDGKITGGENDKDVLSTEFTKYLGIDGKKTQIDMAYNFSLIEHEMDQEAYISSEKIYTMASTGSLDGYLAEYDYIDFFSSDREVFFYDLVDLFSEEELELLKDNIIYYTKENGEKTAIAVDITNAPKIKSTDLTIKRPCYGVVVSSKYPDNGADFIRYVFNMPRK